MSIDSLVAEEIETNRMGTFQCQLCDHEPFISTSGLRYHMINKHGGVQSMKLGDHTCPECGYQSTRNGVKLHRSLKHGVKGTYAAKRDALIKARKEKTFGCSYCEFRSGTKAGITRHTRNHHPYETGVAMMGKPAVKIAQPAMEFIKDKERDRTIDRVLAMVADRIYNKLMEEL